MSQKSQRKKSRVTLYLNVSIDLKKRIEKAKPELISGGVFAGHLLELGLAAWNEAGKRAGGASHYGNPPALPS